MRTATKSGATSATSTGPARRRLSFSRKPAPRRNKAEQPAVDGREAQRDQAKPKEVLRREDLVQEQGAQEDRDGGNKQRHEKGIGRARRRDQPEVHHVTKRRAHQSQRGDRRNRRQWREGMRPRAVNEQRH